MGPTASLRGPMIPGHPQAATVAQMSTKWMPEASWQGSFQGVLRKIDNVQIEAVAPDA